MRCSATRSGIPAQPMWANSNSLRNESKDSKWKQTAMSFNSEVVTQCLASSRQCSLFKYGGIEKTFRIYSFESMSCSENVVEGLIFLQDIPHNCPRLKTGFDHEDFESLNFYHLISITIRIFSRTVQLCKISQHCGGPSKLLLVIGHQNTALETPMCKR